MSSRALTDLFESIKRHQLYLARRPGGQRLMMKGARFSALEGQRWNLSEAILPNTLWIDGDFTEAKFDRADLFCADITRAQMSRASFERADMRGIVALDTILVGAILRNADLRPGKTVQWDGGGSRAPRRDRAGGDHNAPSAAGGADGQDAPVEKLRPANFTRADIRGGDLSGIHADFAILAGADLTDADLSGATLKSANLLGANVTRARFRNANLSHANLRNVDLTKADLTGAQLGHAVFRRSDAPLPPDVAEALAQHSLWINSDGRSGARLNLTGAGLAQIDLEGSDLRAAVFRGADLSGANLADCDLTLADLTGADLTHATLNRAVLTGANLSDVRFQGARLRGAELGHVKIRDPQGRDTGRRAPTIIVAADFELADLRGAQFRDTDPAGARFLGALLDGSDLRADLAMVG